MTSRSWLREVPATSCFLLIKDLVRASELDRKAASQPCFNECTQLAVTLLVAMMQNRWLLSNAFFQGR